MGEHFQFRSPFSTHSGAPDITAPNPETNQESPTPFVPSNSFSSSAVNSVFGASQQNVESSGPKNSIFGGSVFVKPSENPFAASGPQRIFGGALSQNAPQQSNMFKTEETRYNSESSLFSRPQMNTLDKPTIFGVVSPKSGEEASSVSSNNVFGGSFISQTSAVKPVSFGEVASKSLEPSKPTDTSIFGGTYLGKAQESRTNLPGMTSLFGIPKDPSLEEQPSDNLSSASSRMSNNDKLISSPLFQQKKNDQSSTYHADGVKQQLKARKLAEEEDPDWEPDSIEEGDREDNSREPPKKSLKIVRKRGLLEKAIQEATKPFKRDQRAEKSRSIECCPVNGEVADQQTLKDYFSMFNVSRVCVNKEKRYGLATFKTHEDAVKAMNGGCTIDGKEYKFFWRNVRKPRRSTEDIDQSKVSESMKKVHKRSALELDPEVREELEAISGTDYLTHHDANSKKEGQVASKGRSQSLSKPKVMDNVYNEPGLKKEGSDVGENTSIRTRISRPSVSKLKPRTAKEVKELKEGKRFAVSSRESISGKKTSSSHLKEEHGESKSQPEEQTPPDNKGGSTALVSELLQILKRQVTTAEDKLQVLDARDKLIRLQQVKQYDISKAVKTVGTCRDMCPEKERLLRETRRQISQYEMSPFKVTEIDSNLMVKQYSRSSADQEEPLPHELRSPATLTMTMNYLMHTIMNHGDRPGENLGEWYHFLWDRLRGIRKEITQQELCDADAVSLVEQCARFHIHCGARLVAEDMSVFDDRINTENLTKCLQTLKHMYHDLWINNSITCPNEPEFITYFILLNLNNGTIMWEMEQLREEVLESPEILFAAAMYSSLSSNNFVRFFRLVRKATYLNSCLCIRYFYQVRAQALNTCVKALAKFRPVMYPLASLIEDLGFESAERAAAFCSHHGLQVENVSSESALVILSQETFFNPNSVLPCERAFKLAEAKRMGTVGEVANGGPLPAQLYEGHSVHNSFDKNGYLRKSAYLAKDQGAADSKIKDGDGYDGIEDMEENASVLPPKAAAFMDAEVTGDIKQSSEISPQTIFSTANFGSFGSKLPVLSSTFATFHTGAAPSGSLPSNQALHPTATPSFTLQTSFGESASVKPHISQLPKVVESMKRSVFQNEALQAQAKIEAEKRAQVEKEKAIDGAAEVQMQDLLDNTTQEFITETALIEFKEAENTRRAEEQQRADAQLQAQEELRRRILDAHIERISNETVADLLDDVIQLLVIELAQDVHSEEEQLLENIKSLSEESLISLVSLVTKEECQSVATQEFRIALNFARQEAVKLRVKEVFYFWLQRARLSLHRKHIMTDFPAGIIPLSIKEHAERWGFPAYDMQNEFKEVRYKSHDKTLDLPDLREVAVYPQTTFAELVGIQAIHRYDIVRSKLGLRPTDQLLYKLFVSVPEESNDPSSLLIDWWMRRSFKQTCSIVYDDALTGVYRLVSGLRVTSEVVVYTSLQMVRGKKLLEKQPTLASGTSAILFTVSPSSNIQSSRSRLTTLLGSMHKSCAVPLVVTVVCPSEPPLDGLKQLVLELELDQWMDRRVICDYQILHVEELYDVKYLSERFNMALNYMIMTWTPSPEYSLVSLKNILKSTFQMFYISIQFNYNSSGLYPQNIDDPRVIMGLCNEWLELMSQEVLASYHEARDLCGCEFWPLLHKGAFLPFFHFTSYEQFVKEVMQSISLPPLEWPPSSEEEFERTLEHYCSWLKPDEENQTLKRLSILNGLTWPEKLKAIPWINLIEDWVEARISYSNTSCFDGAELLCLIRTQNVEDLYSHPWWAQSKHVISYLEVHKTGNEEEMDVDQSIDYDNDQNENLDASKTAFGQKINRSAGSELLQLQEVADSVSELKNANEMFITRLKNALANECSVSSQPEIIVQQDVQSADRPPKNCQGIDSLMKTVDLQVKAQLHKRNEISHLLSSALAEDCPTTYQLPVNQPITSAQTTMVNQSVENKSLKADDDCNTKKNESLKKMEDIMSSMGQLVSSLNQKYKITNSASSLEKITGLRMGYGKVDAESVPQSTDKLEHSSYVRDSQLFMRKRLHRETHEEQRAEREKPVSGDSELEILSDNNSVSTHIRSVTSPSSFESDSDASLSDTEGSKYSRRKRRCLSINSDSDHDQSTLSSQSDLSDEIQTISSEDSTEHNVTHQHHTLSSESPTHHVDEGNSVEVNSDISDTELHYHNGHLARENEVEDEHNTFNFINNCESYNEGVVHERESEFLVSTEVGILCAEDVCDEEVVSLGENSKVRTELKSGELCESREYDPKESCEIKDNLILSRCDPSREHNTLETLGNECDFDSAKGKGSGHDYVKDAYTSDGDSHCDYSSQLGIESTEVNEEECLKGEGSQVLRDKMCSEENEVVCAEDSEEESVQEDEEECVEEAEEECAEEAEEECVEEVEDGDELCAEEVDDEEDGDDVCAEEVDDEEEYTEEGEESFRNIEVDEEEFIEEDEEEEEEEEMEAEVDSEPDEDSDICEIIDDD